MAGWTPITPVSRGPRLPSDAEEPAAGKTKGGGGGVFRVQENSHCNAAEKQRDFKQRRAAAQQKQRDLKNSLIDKLRGIVPAQGGSQDNSKRAKHAVLTDTIVLLKRLQSEPNNQAALTEWQNGEANGAAPDPSSDLEDGDATVEISAVPGGGNAADEEIETELARKRKLAWGRIRGFAMGSRPPPPRPAAGQASGPKRSRPATQDTPAAKRHEPAAAPAEAAGIAERRWDVREAELKTEAVVEKTAELASFNTHLEALRQINASLLASNVSLLASNAQKDEQLQAQQVELDARQEKLHAQQELIAHLLADSPDLVRLLSRAGAQ